jgi:hypothetical protein
MLWEEKDNSLPFSRRFMNLRAVMKYPDSRINQISTPSHRIIVAFVEFVLGYSSATVLDFHELPSLHRQLSNSEVKVVEMACFES